MSSAPRQRGDFIDRYARMEERARLERIRRKGHTESKTFIVGGDINPRIYIPPFFIGLDSGGGTPEFKIIWGFRGVMSDGSIVVDWYLNGIVLTRHTISTNNLTSEKKLAGPPVYVADGDMIQPDIFDGIGLDLSAAVVFTTSPR